MVAFDKEKARFNFRVAGVAIHNGHVLLDRNSRNSYWVLPGGHPEMMEPMADALRREVKEEIGADVEVVRLLWVMENFFYKNKDIHELSFYFLMELNPESPLLRNYGPFYGKEHTSTLTYQWFPLDETLLRELPLNPSYLAASLIRIPTQPEHIVFHDAKKSVSKRLTIS